MRKYPGGRLHVDDVTLTRGRLFVELLGGGMETIPVTKTKVKIAATAAPAIANLRE